VARHTATVCFVSVLGAIEVEASPEGVTRVRLAAARRPREVGGGVALDFARSAGAEIQAYLAGDLRKFSVPLVVEGTPFQKGVWREIGRIPFGQQRSYGQLASKLGRARAARAIGAACAANPVPILIPCHRVTASDGSLAGFGGGLDLKRALLDLERRVAAVGP